MADWYVSSAAWTAIAQFAVSTAYTVGQIVRPLTAPAIGSQHAFRCTTAGTSGTEPAWTNANGGTNTTGGATFTNVSSQSTYGWSAAAGSLQTINYTGGGARVSIGDRIFVSSDHSESVNGGSLAFGSVSSFGFALTQLISVNRAGSVPPVQADVLSGATLTLTASVTFDPYSQTLYQGFAFIMAGGSSLVSLLFCGGGQKPMILRNCTITFTNTNANSRIATGGPVLKLRLDNVPITFAAAGQGFGNTAPQMFDLIWMNTPNAILGTVPTQLFSATQNSASASQSIVCRGVDLSAVTGTLLTPSTSGGPLSSVLLDSCRIAPSLVRYGTPGSTGNLDEVELVNCFDGTNLMISERHTPAGDLTTNRSTTLVGGAQDDVGLFSHQMVSSVRSDSFAMPLDSFWLDVENLTFGAGHTATVEIISSVTLNNTDISLTLEYLGTSGSSLASFATSLPSPLTTVAALPTSSASWNSPPATPVAQRLQVAFTPQQVGRLRAVVRLGRPSTTVYVNPQIAVT
jgi:hypothetical protein